MKQKPIVTFVGEADFFTDLITDEQKELYKQDSNEITQAVVYGVVHPILGRQRKVITSIVVNKFDDGSFETLNTIYKPHNDLS
jgi:hypothetical protein